MIAMSVGILVSLFTWMGFNPIGVLDEAVGTFILFGGVIESYAAAKDREYISMPLKAWAWFGISIVTFLGIYAFASSEFPVSSAIIVLTVLIAFALNGKIERKLKLRRMKTFRRRS